MKTLTAEMEFGQTVKVWLEKPDDACVYFSIGEDDSQPEVTGSIKYDGCMNWSTSDAVMAHFCSPNDAGNLLLAFLKAWELGKELLGDKADKGYGT